MFKIWVVFTISCLNLVTGFSWTNCGNASDPISISSLNVFQTQSLVLQVKGQGSLSFDIESPIKLHLLVERKIFIGWTPVPCIDGVGTCTYDNVCALSPYTDICPDIFAGLPCKCPVKKGSYGGSLVIDLNSANLPKWLEKGSYRLTATLTDVTTSLLCLQVTLQLK